MCRTDSNGLELESREENKEALEDLTYNADLFIGNQEEVGIDERLFQRDVNSLEITINII